MALANDIKRIVVLKHEAQMNFSKTDVKFCTQ